ncbi:chemotaxis protein, partial [Arcobacter sp. FW59]
VNELDRQTQQNAMVASQTNEIALGADEIAKLIVEDANAKEFVGKNEVKSKNLESNKVNRKIEDTSKEKTIKTTSNTKSKVEVVKDNTKDDEWESF